MTTPTVIDGLLVQWGARHSMTWGTAGRFGRNRPFIRSVGVTALAAGTIAAQ